MRNFARCELTDRSVAIQILTLLMWQNFNTKQGTQKKTPKNGRYGNPQHTFFTKFCTKELSSLRILSSFHKATKSHIFMM